MQKIKNLLIFALCYIVFSNEDLSFNCSSIQSITECLEKSNFCYVLEANVPYLLAENNTEGVILDKVNDICVNLNFFTVCDQLQTEKSCKRGNCLWDPTFTKCYKWDSAPCSSYPVSLCQWNNECEIINQTQILDLNQNYTIMNNQDSSQNDGRKNGTWLYEFGLIVDVKQIDKDKEEYNFTKCSLKNRCEYIQIIDYNQADYECSISDLNCYFDNQENKCKKISAQTQCELINWQSQCNSGTAPCIWINNKCQMYDSAVVTCGQLDSNRCLNNENCYIQDQKCRSYLSCADFKIKASCDESNYFCYFDEYQQQCKQLTKHIQCKKIGKKNCLEFKYCQLNQANNEICEELLQEFYCQKFIKTDCPNNSKLQTQKCIWNENLQICNWNYSTQNCDDKTVLNCDDSENQCYYDQAMGKCSTIQPNLTCELIGYYSCNNIKIQQQNFCQWSQSRNLCLSIFDFNCEELLTPFCKYFGKCYEENKICKTRKQCKDNVSITDCQQDSQQSCYFDYEYKLCRRVTAQTSCDLIFNNLSCNQAICSWFNNKCQNIEKASCKQIDPKNCKYSSKCLLQNDKCIPVDVCEENNGNSKACVQDQNHCFYNPSTQICKHIDGNTDCSLLNDKAENCNYGHCFLSSSTNRKLQCIKLENAQCLWLKEDQCNFGKCAWNQTKCIPYPVVIEPQDNPTIKPDEKPTEEETITHSPYLVFFINLLIIILA